MYREEVLGLKALGTWKLFFLSIVTLGIYFGYYVKKQSRKIDSISSNRQTLLGVGGKVLMPDPVGQRYGNILLIFGYLDLVILFYEIIEPERGVRLEAVTDMVSFVFSIVTLIWCFKVKNIMNTQLSLSEGSPYWFSSVWTLFCSPFYFNYKLNCICEALEAKQEFSFDA
ncbi:DUF4234 domain-containing protein [Thaumasiovibrio subtropicus]|uniref:DUF4234 domain-containing protein n=2 Tax=Thaumasiovibrio subtropicus TaxID=1891207 RepID=UPI001C858166|nr:DUF4234 domain-containing protein [Thaumasiovibrio subtropicus]